MAHLRGGVEADTAAADDDDDFEWGIGRAVGTNDDVIGAIGVVVCVCLVLGADRCCAIVAAAAFFGMPLLLLPPLLVLLSGRGFLLLIFANSVVCCGGGRLFTAFVSIFYQKANHKPMLWLNLLAPTDLVSLECPKKKKKWNPFEK